MLYLNFYPTVDEVIDRPIGTQLSKRENPEERVDTLFQQPDLRTILGKSKFRDT